MKTFKYFNMYTKLMVVIVAVIVLLLQQSFSKAGAEENYVKVIEYSGDITITDKDGKEKELYRQMRLESGEVIVTDKRSFVDIALDDEDASIVRIGAKSNVAILFDGKNDLELVNGEMFVLLSDLEAGEEFRVKTPCAVVGARGTGWKLTTDGQTAVVAVIDDQVFVFGINQDGSISDEEFWVFEGFEAKIDKFEKAGEIRELTREEMDNLKTEIGEYMNRADGEYKIYKKALKMEKLLNKFDKMTDEKRESILEEKDDSRVADAEDRRGGSSDSGGRGDDNVSPSS